jgi:hypothetical protein
MVLADTNVAGGSIPLPARFFRYADLHLASFVGASFDLARDDAVNTMTCAR